MLNFNLGGPINSLLPVEDRKPTLDAMASGNQSLIFDDKGNFLVNPKPSTGETIPTTSFRFKEVSALKDDRNK